MGKGGGGEIETGDNPPAGLATDNTSVSTKGRKAGWLGQLGVCVVLNGALSGWACLSGGVYWGDAG